MVAGIAMGMASLFFGAMSYKEGKDARKDAKRAEDEAIRRQEQGKKRALAELDNPRTSYGMQRSNMHQINAPGFAGPTPRQTFSQSSPYVTPNYNKPTPRITDPTRSLNRPSNNLYSQYRGR